MVLLLALVSLHYPANSLFIVQPTFSHYSQRSDAGSLLPEGYGAQHSELVNSLTADITQMKQKGLASTSTV